MTTYNKDLFGQDLQNYINAVKMKDFRTGNILGNRIMSNAYLFDEKNYGLIGFFLKQIMADALTLRNLNDPDAISAISNAAMDFVQNTIEPQLNSMLINYEKIWTGYNNVIIKTRQAFIPKSESVVYKQNSEVSSEAFKRILTILFQNKNHLSYLSNNLLKGILNEMNRIGRTYGTSRSDAYTLSILTMIDRVDEYVGLTVIDKDDFEMRVKAEIIPHIEQLEKIHNDLTVENTNELLWKLIIMWRLNFIKFLDVRRSINQAPPQIQQDTRPPVKSKLVEELAKSLEDEIGGK